MKEELDDSPEYERFISFALIKTVSFNVEDVQKFSLIDEHLMHKALCYCIQNGLHLSQSDIDAVIACWYHYLTSGQPATYISLISSLFFIFKPRPYLIFKIGLNLLRHNYFSESFSLMDYYREDMFEHSKEEFETANDFLHSLNCCYRPIFEFINGRKDLIGFSFQLLERYISDVCVGSKLIFHGTKELINSQYFWYHNTVKECFVNNDNFDKSQIRLVIKTLTFNSGEKHIIPSSDIASSGVIDSKYILMLSRNRDKFVSFSDIFNRIIEKFFAFGFLVCFEFVFVDISF